MLPFLQVLAERGRSSLQEMRVAIAERLALPPEVIEEPLESGRQTKYESRVGWARTYLTKSGLVIAVSRGVFELSDTGRGLLGLNPARVDKTTLLQYEPFREWVKESRNSNSLETRASLGEVPPEEAIASGHKQLEDALVDEILESLLRVTWQRFEEIVVDVLQALGYGGRHEGAGRAFKTAGDEGVDGVIDEDPLGLSKVYVQAKKYQRNRTVGRPDIQAFAGSLLGKRSNQGVLLTTGAFTLEAISYADALPDPRIVLIDGRRLAQLMISAGVGVIEHQRYVIHRLDSDYFNE